MIPLSARTRETLGVLFAPGDVDEAEELLLAWCDEAFANGHASSEHVDRLQLAALRLSGGTLAALKVAIKLAQEDWRDLLVAAGFGYDAHAHQHWQPQRFTPEEAAAWRRGTPVPHVRFRPGAAVEILTGRFKRQRGEVHALIALEPEPRFRVRTARGRQTEVPQSGLQPAG